MAKWLNALYLSYVLSTMLLSMQWSYPWLNSNWKSVDLQLGGKKGLKRLMEGLTHETRLRSRKSEVKPYQTSVEMDLEWIFLTPSEVWLECTWSWVAWLPLEFELLEGISWWSFVCLWELRRVDNPLESLQDFFLISWYCAHLSLTLIFQWEGESP